jgi:hypothetical protein
MLKIRGYKTEGLQISDNIAMDTAYSALKSIGLESLGMGPLTPGGANV